MDKSRRESTPNRSNEGPGSVIKRHREGPYNNGQEQARTASQDGLASAVNTYKPTRRSSNWASEWAKPRAVELTPEEQKLQEDLAAAAATRTKWAQRESSPDLDSLTMSLARKARPQASASTFRKVKVNSEDPEEEKAIGKVNYIAGDSSSLTKLLPDWQHVKRRSDTREHMLDSSGNSSIQANQNIVDIELNDDPARARLAQERDERQRNNADGRFVGFGEGGTSRQSPRDTFSIRMVPPAPKRFPDSASNGWRAEGWVDSQTPRRDSGSDRRWSQREGYGEGAVDERLRGGYKVLESKPTDDRLRDRLRARKTAARRYEEEDEERDEVMSRIEQKRQRRKEREAEQLSGPPRPILLPEFISIGNLAKALRVRMEKFSAKMRALGFEDMNNDHVLDAETAGLVATEFNYEPVVADRVEYTQEDLVAMPPAVDKTLLPQRPPIITIMGHVDHGKTTLLDWLRKSSVAASEHGGITQHIGAFTVPMPSGRTITFLDTPGHAAFLSMRQRGANVTDIVILVVAADDSVKPQTIEAIKHAQSAKVPMIVAVNKIDKPDSDVERVKQDLARHGVEIEDFGGETQVVCVSGKTGQGMEELEDAAVTLADVLDLRAETHGEAEGWVLEATTRRAGRVATVLVRRGTIYPGTVIVAGNTWSRVRSLRNEAGISVPSAGPGTPVEIDGWRDQPEAGDEVLEAPDEQKAKSVVELRLAQVEKEKMVEDVLAVNESRRLEQEKRELEKQEREKREQEKTATTENLKDTAVVPAQPKGATEVPFIVRADVSGSVEAILDSISSIGNSEVRPLILRSAVGPIVETDVEHAAVAKGHIVTFNNPIDGGIRRMAEVAGVSILDQSIIYRLMDDVKAKLEEMLPDLVTTRVVGEAEVAAVFSINIKGRVMVPVAGCKVRNGVISRSTKVRVVRGGETVYDGECLAPRISLCIWRNSVS